MEGSRARNGDAWRGCAWVHVPGPAVSPTSLSLGGQQSIDPLEPHLPSSSCKAACVRFFEHEKQNWKGP